MHKLLILDGAMGTMLQAAGMKGENILRFSDLIIPV